MSIIVVDVSVLYVMQYSLWTKWYLPTFTQHAQKKKQ